LAGVVGAEERGGHVAAAGCQAVDRRVLAGAVGALEETLGGAVEVDREASGCGGCAGGVETLIGGCGWAW
jgi:hypothetical protein